MKQTWLVAGALAWLAAAVPALAQAPTPTPNGPAPRRFLLADADGCPFCCSFTCQLTPTPTPALDAEGRQIFFRHDGSGFLVIVEAPSGVSSEGSYVISASNGDRILTPITNLTGRPSMQLLAKNNLGNGSPTVCDLLPPNVGGVPGIPSLDFDPGSTVVTNALIDMACRFDVLSSTIPCTRNRYGDFSFLDSGTVRQFCWSVPSSGEFPDGDTVLALQLLGTNGALGPRKEIVVRVGQTPAPPATPTPTLTKTATPAARSIAGRIRYYFADRSVGGATVTLTGPVQNSTATNSSGNYAFNSLSASTWKVEPSKHGDLGAGISSLDAAYILQYLTDQRQLTDLQRLACDVTGNGSLSSLDAARILQFKAELLPGGFTVANTCNSDWAFAPMPSAAPNQTITAPLMSIGSCQKGAITYSPLSGQITGQDFYGVLFGDCTGNWQPSLGASTAVRSGGAMARLGRARRLPHRRLRVPLTLAGRGTLSAADVVVKYDPNQLRPIAARPVLGARRAMVAAGVGRPGQLSIALASARPVEHRNRPILVLDFERLTRARGRAGVHVAAATVDEAAARTE